MQPPGARFVEGDPRAVDRSGPPFLEARLDDHVVRGAAFLLGVDHETGRDLGQVGSGAALHPVGPGRKLRIDERAGGSAGGQGFAARCEHHGARRAGQLLVELRMDDPDLVRLRVAVGIGHAPTESEAAMADAGRDQVGPEFLRHDERHVLAIHLDDQARGPRRGGLVPCPAADQGVFGRLVDRADRVLELELRLLARSLRHRPRWSGRRHLCCGLHRCRLPVPPRRRRGVRPSPTRTGRRRCWWLRAPHGTAPRPCGRRRRARSGGWRRPSPRRPC